MCSKGPGYASPLDAMKNGPREELLYVCCIQPNLNDADGDLLATIDVDPLSPTFCKIIHRLHTGQPNDELHHSGWNVCSSCHEDTGCSDNTVSRDKLILPCLNSDRVLIADIGDNPRKPTLYKAIPGEAMRALNCATPHTAHCLANGNIMISCLGDKEGNGKCEFILVDNKSFEVKGTWTHGDKHGKFAYDFWYQPYHDTLISTEWGAPRIFKRGFHPEDHENRMVYGTCLNFYKWSTHELVQTIDLGSEGAAPLEVRFLHDPKEAQGYVGCAIFANIFRFFKKEDGTWAAEKVIDIKPKKVTGWLAPYIQGMITDILISLDDKYLYLNNWLHGDVRQYDITNRAKPKLTGQVFLGGKILKDSAIKVIQDEELGSQPEPVYIKGKRLRAGPQMMQLSLDGKRLYISNSLYSPWDKQFYPEAVESGSYIVQLDVDTQNGGMKINENFLVDFGPGNDGPLLAHEMRYPGGDCTSDIWLVSSNSV